MKTKEQAKGYRKKKKQVSKDLKQSYQMPKDKGTDCELVWRLCTWSIPHTMRADNQEEATEQNLDARPALQA